MLLGLEVSPTSDRRGVGVGFLGSGSVLWAYLRALDQLTVRGLAWQGPISARRRETWSEIERRRPAVNLVPKVADVLSSDVDVVVIITPPASHAELAIAAIDAGKHVLIEKPMGMTRAEAEKVLARATEQRVRVVAAPFVLLAATVQALWRVVADGELGAVHSVRAMYGNAGPTWARWFFESGVGPLGDLAVYNLKTLTAMFGPIETVTAMGTTAVLSREVAGSRIDVGEPDTFHIIVRHRSGTISSLMTSHAVQQYRRPGIEIYGTEGTANLLGDDHSPAGLEVWTNDEGSWRFTPPPDDTWHWTDGLRELVTSLSASRAPFQELQQDLHLIDVLEAIRLSARAGESVSVSSVFPELVPPTSGAAASGQQHVHDRSRPLDEQF